MGRLINGRWAISATGISLENEIMTRIWLAAPAALTLIAGAAMAQTSSETTTTTNTYVPVPVAPAPVVPPPITQRTVDQRTVDSNGDVTEKTMSTGTTVGPLGETTTTRRTTETTTVR
jgi:hypothetical protein